MIGLENILREIETQGTESAAEILRNAKTAAEQVITRAEADARSAAEEFEARANAAAQAKIERSAANDIMNGKRAVLEKKQELIRDTITKVRRELSETRDARYYEVLKAFLDRSATGEAGVAVLCAKDTANPDEDFYGALTKHGLTISDNTIAADGGFVLIYGSIEINCTFEAVFDECADELSDMLSVRLFEQAERV